MIGLALDKSGVHFAALDADGKVVTRRRHTKTKLIEVTDGLEPCRIGREACCGAHQLGWVLPGQGPNVKLMAPKCVNPFVKRNKNDAKDAEACAEACLRPTMRFVKVESAAQLSMQSLHRYRSRQVKNATQLINQARAACTCSRVLPCIASQCFRSTARRSASAVPAPAPAGSVPALWPAARSSCTARRTASLAAIPSPASAPSRPAYS